MNPTLADQPPEFHVSMLISPGFPAGLFAALLAGPWAIPVIITADHYQSFVLNQSLTKMI
jgi:hypothetical protein